MLLRIFRWASLTSLAQKKTNATQSMNKPRHNNHLFLVKNSLTFPCLSLTN